MKKIDIKGRIIGNGNTWIYDLLKIPYACPLGVIQGLQEANGDSVEIHINSGGGSVYDGYEIYNAIAEYKGDVTIKIVGLAASAASFISQAPNAKCFMSPLAQMMIHNSATYAEGPHQSMDSTSQMLQVTDSTIAKAYSIKSKRPESEIRDLMEAETWLTSEKAMELGLIDGIMFEAKTESKPVSKLYNALNLDDDVILSDLEKCKTVDELKNRLTENLEKMFKNAKDGGKTTLINSINDDKNNKKEDSNMTAEEFKAQNGDLYNQIVNEVTNSATKAERERIIAINNLSQPGLENIIEKGIEDGLSAGDVAVNIINFQKQQGAKQLQNMVDDAEKSGVNNVKTQVNSQKSDTKEDEKKNAINLLVDAAKCVTGGNQ